MAAGRWRNQLFPAASDITDGAGHTLVTAYAVKRPDGQWSVMLINKDQENSHRVRLEFTGAHAQFSGTVEESLFGSGNITGTPRARFNAHLPELSQQPCSSSTTEVTPIRTAPSCTNRFQWK